MKSTRAFWEMLVVLTVMLVGTFTLPAYKQIFAILPFFYILIEKFVRRRRWTELGFNIGSTGRDIVHNLGLILLVGIGTQVLAIAIGFFLVPDYLAHVLGRIPIDLAGSLPVILFSFLIATLGEEIVYRGFYQERLGWKLGPIWGLILAALVFAGMHFEAAAPQVVLTDLTLIFVDGVIYGLIYARCRNIFASWVAHFIADLVGLGLILLLALK